VISGLDRGMRSTVYHSTLVILRPFRTGAEPACTSVRAQRYYHDVYPVRRRRSHCCYCCCCCWHL